PVRDGAGRGLSAAGAGRECAAAGTPALKFAGFVYSHCCAGRRGSTGGRRAGNLLELRGPELSAEAERRDSATGATGPPRRIARSRNRRGAGTGPAAGSIP